jgi:hypothetical protein
VNRPNKKTKKPKKEANQARQSFIVMAGKRKSRQTGKRKGKNNLR